MDNLFGRGRKRETNAATDRLIVVEIKSNQCLLVHWVKAEIEAKL